MAQPSASYSSLKATADALHSYEIALRARQQVELQARTSRDRETQQAKEARDRAIQQAQAARTRSREQARQLVESIEHICREADKALADLEIPIPAVGMSSAPSGPGKSANQMLWEQCNEAKAASADFENAVKELVRYRRTFIARLRRTLHLPP